MRLVAWVLCMVLVPAIAGVAPVPATAEEQAFTYVHEIESGMRHRVSIEHEAATQAADAGEAERWAVTVMLMIEMARSASDPIERGLMLDAALAQLTRHDSRQLIAALSADRRGSLRRSLESFDSEDPVGLRGHTRRLAQQRLGDLKQKVLEAEDPVAGLDAMLETHGSRRAGSDGPLGRQRAEDRQDFRSVTRHEVFQLEGMARWHILLPPTEARQGVPLEELDQKWQRARNLMVHSDRLWAHQDGPRLHDMLLNLMMRDATGIVRLVHADTQRLAHADRERRWRLRESLARLGG